jgi:hypothetical protein
LTESAIIENKVRTLAPVRMSNDSVTVVPRRVEEAERPCYRVFVERTTIVQVAPQSPLSARWA